MQLRVWFTVVVAIGFSKYSFANEFITPFRAPAMSPNKTLTYNVTTCPYGWTRVGEPGAPSTFCIETDERKELLPWKKALELCSNIVFEEPYWRDARLCKSVEWETACEYSDVKDMRNNGEWVSDEGYGSGPLEFRMIFGGSYGCDLPSYQKASDPASYRCCLSLGE
jgi:hypothetical protein